MSDQTPYWQRQNTGGEGELPAALTDLEHILLADGEDWRRSDLSTSRLAAYVRSLADAKAALMTSVSAAQGSREPTLTDIDVSSTYQPSPLSRSGSLGRSSPTASRWTSLAAACLIVVLGASFFALLSTHPLSGPTGQHGSATAGSATPAVTGTPTIARQTATLPAQTHLALPAGGYLSAISFSSAQDGWVGGGIRVDDVPGANWSVAKAYLVHYHQGAWTTYPQTFAQASIEQISMLSVDEGWAIAQHNFDPATNTQGTTFLLHYSGGQWREIDDPAFANLVPDSLMMRSPIFGYATGAVVIQSDPNSAHEVVLLLMNGQWHRLQTPFLQGQAQIVMFTPDDGYALGVADGLSGFYHYSNGTWASMPTPISTMSSFTMPAPNNAWAAGLSCVKTATPTPYQACAISASHWDGASWTQLPPISVSGTGYYDNRLLYSFATIVGQYWVGLSFDNGGQNPSQRQYTTLLYRYVSGQWQRVLLPLAHTMLVNLGAAMGPSSWDGYGGTWTIAWSENPNVNYVLYTQGGAWQVYGQG